MSFLSSAVSTTFNISKTLSHEAFLRGKQGVFATQAAVDAVVQFTLSNLNGTLYLFSALTTGVSLHSRKYTGEHDAAFGSAMAGFYLNALRILNPHAKLLKTNSLENRKGLLPAPGFLPKVATPIFLSFVSQLQQNMINSLQSSLLHRHLTARIIAPLSSILALLAGVGFFTFGALNAALSVITLGTKPFFNTMAYHGILSMGYCQNQWRQALLGIFRPSLLSSKT